MDHKNGIITDPQFEKLWNSPVLHFLTKEYESELSSDELLRVIGICCTNVVSIVEYTVASAIAGSLFTTETWW